MSQNSVDYSGNPTGSQLMDNYLAKSQDNVLTTNSGVQRPSYAKSGTQWIDTSSNPWKLYLYNGSIDVLIGTISTGSSGAFIVSGVDDSSYVKLTGTQTVGGNKTFSSLLNVSVDGVKFATESGTNYYQVRASGSPKVGLSFLLNNSTSYAAMNLTSSSITIGSANITPLSVTPATSDNSTKIATTAYVKNQGYASDSAVVKLSGDQTIANTKTFTGNPTINKSSPMVIEKDTRITKGTNPESSVTGYPVLFRDSANTNMSWWYYQLTTSGNAYTRFYTAKSVSGSSNSAYIEVRYESNGHYGLYFAGTSSDTNDSIAGTTTSTTSSMIPCKGWVNARLNTKFQQVNSLPSSPDADTFYFIPES